MFNITIQELNHNYRIGLTSVLFLPRSKYVANTSSYRTCDNDSSMSCLLYPIATRASTWLSMDGGCEWMFLVFCFNEKEREKRKLHLKFTCQETK